MTDPIFIDAPDSVHHGDHALQRLAETNDSQYATEDGILKVDKARWKQAQEYERRTWMDLNPGSIDDRNGQHADAFNQYQGLPDDLGEYVELGCGPFTNSRIILDGRKASSVTLLDPLIEQYLKHPNCHYKEGTLAGHTVETVASTIEGWTRRKKFDTIVCINVLQHCYDAPAAFDTITRLLKKGGYLVFGEWPREHDPLRLYDVGHPIAIHTPVLEAFLAQFEEVYRNGYYFIGRGR